MGILSIGAYFDYGTFQIFAKTGIGDLSARMVLDPNGNADIPAPSNDKSENINSSTAGQSASANRSADNYLDLSLAYYQAKRFPDCIDASRKALSLKPDFAAAYNNICAAYNAIGQWDSAIVAGREAVRLDPGNNLAKNNLAFAEAERQKASDAKK